MGQLFEFPHTAAKPKRVPQEDGPTQVPMGRLSPAERRNPDRGQHKVRLQQQRRKQKTAVAATAWGVDPGPFGVYCAECDKTIHSGLGSRKAAEHAADLHNQQRHGEGSKTSTTHTADDLPPLCELCGTPTDSTSDGASCANCGMTVTSAVSGPCSIGNHRDCAVPGCTCTADEHHAGPHPKAKTGAGSERWCAICGAGVHEDASGQLVHVGGDQDHEPEEAIQGNVGGEWGVRRPVTGATNKYPGTCPDCGSRVSAGEGVRTKEQGKWVVRHKEGEHEDERAGPWRSGYGEYPMADEIYDLTHSYEGAKESSMTVQQETDLLNAMAKATPDEQRRLAADLEGLRARTRNEARAAFDLDTADAVIRDHLTPVATHGLNTSGTDWFGDISVEAFYDDDLDLAIRAEASRWFNRTVPELRADPAEFFEQAQGMARRTAGLVGDITGQAEQAFLSHACHLAGITLEAAEPVEHTEESMWPIGDSPDAGSLNWPITSPEPVTTGDTNTGSEAPGVKGSLRRQAEDAYDKGKTNNDPPGWYYIDSKGADTGPFSDDEKEDMEKSRTKDADYHWFKKSKLASPQPGDADDSGQGVSKLPMQVLPSDNDTTQDNFAPAVDPLNSGITEEDTSSMRAPVIQENKQESPESGGSSGNAGETADESGQGVSSLPYPEKETATAYSSLAFRPGGSYVGADGHMFVCVAAHPDGTFEWEDAGVIDLSRGQVQSGLIHRHAAAVFAGGGLDNLGDDRAKEFGKDNDEDEDDKKESARKLAEGGQKCKVCGADIERDPKGEDNRTWHHSDGAKHDHEAEPSSDSDSDSDDSGGKPWEKKESALVQTAAWTCPYPGCDQSWNEVPTREELDRHMKSHETGKSKGSLRRQAYWYCPTHDVAVGDKNRDTHAGCKLVERKTKEASEPMADPSGQGVSSLPTPEDDPAVAWEWELDEAGQQTDKGAADVAGVPNPARGYPQPTAAAQHTVAARQQAFRNRVQRGLRQRGI